MYIINIVIAINQILSYFHYLPQFSWSKSNWKDVLGTTDTFIALYATLW